MEQTGILVTAEVITALTKRVTVGSSSGNLRLSPVPFEYLDDFLLTCLPVLQAAVDKTDELDIASLVDLLREERAVLVIEYLDDMPQGCFVSLVIEHPLIKVCEIIAIAGFPGKTMRYPNRDSLDLLKKWAQLMGCTRIQGYTDEAIARLWARIGFRELSRKMGMDI